MDTADSLQASSPQAQLGLPLSDWQALFWGAAVSSIFAFVISVLFHVSRAVEYAGCLGSRRSIYMTFYEEI